MNETAEAAGLQLELRDLKNALAAMRDQLEIAQGDREAAAETALSSIRADGQEVMVSR